jgi:CBS domain-containing protein
MIFNFIMPAFGYIIDTRRVTAVFLHTKKPKVMHGSIVKLLKSPIVIESSSQFLVKILKNSNIWKEYLKMFKQAAKDIMTKKVITATRETTIGELSKILIQNNISGAPVVDKEGTLIGMATDADIITEDLEPIFPIYFDPLIISYAYMDNFEKFEKSMKEYLATPVADIMIKRVKTVRQDTPVSEVARIMVKDRINRIPVVDESNKVLGIISRADILKSMLGELEK